MVKNFITACVLMVASATNSHVYANVPCANAKIVAAALLHKFHEKPSGEGIGQDGTKVTLFISPEGTFSVLVETASGVGCIIAAGDYWEAILPEPVGTKL
jgi:hypothetical protein